MRKPVRSGYRQEFNLLAARATGEGVVATDLDRAWSSNGGGQGGGHLDDLLTNLGSAYIELGRVNWEPPDGLDPVFVDYLSQSVAELNRLLGYGAVRLDDDGNIVAGGGSAPS
jgi:hypothetical protein